jgi:hypothetical protein
VISRMKLAVASALVLVTSSVAAADTLELKDGRVLQGRFLGGTQAVLRFEWGGTVKTFSVNEIVALTFTNNYHDSPPPQPPPQDNGAPAPQQDAPPPPNGASPQQAAAPPQPDGPPVTSTDSLPNAPAPNVPPTPAAPLVAAAPATPAGGYAASSAPPGSLAAVTLPAGQSILIRMIDGVDSKKNSVGDIFHASLETDLMLNGVLVAHRGADVYGKLAYAKEAGHYSGSSELELELNRIVIDGQDYQLVSDDYTLKGKGRGGDTAKKVGGGAVLGAIIGGIAGGGSGAAIGAGVGGAAGAGVQALTRGKEVKVPSETLLEFRLQQPATVNATTR